MDQERTYKWIQDRLRELNAGTIAEVDFRRLQDLAKDDPFVADALEGYQALPHVNHAEYLDSLQRRIKPHKRERRQWLIPNLTVTAVAACLILIIGIWVVMNRLSFTEDKPLATHTSEHKLSMEKIGDTMLITSDTEEVIASAEPKRSETVPVSPHDEPIGSAKPTTSTHTTQGTSKASRDEAQHNSGTSGKPIPTETTNSVSPPGGIDLATGKPNDQTVEAVKEATEDVDDGYYANQIDPRRMAQRVRGRVTSTLGEPLIGANIFVPGSNLGTLSQEDGKFELFLPKADSMIAVDYTGYVSEELSVSPGNDEVNIQLRSSSNVLESVVAGKPAAASRKQEATPNMTPVTLQMNANLLFVDYLRANSRYELADDMDGPTRTVQLEFHVAPDGHPTRINVVQSSGDKSRDEEAVRLIRKGPDWTCSDTYPCQVRYSIYFKN